MRSCSCFSQRRSCRLHCSCFVVSKTYPSLSLRHSIPLGSCIPMFSVDTPDSQPNVSIQARTKGCFLFQDAPSPLPYPLHACRYSELVTVTIEHHLNGFSVYCICTLPVRFLQDQIAPIPTFLVHHTRLE